MLPPLLRDLTEYITKTSEFLIPVARSVRYGNVSLKLIRDRSVFVCDVLSIHLCESDSIAGCSEIITGACF
jgi:hypothetical protein